MALLLVHQDQIPQATQDQVVVRVEMVHQAAAVEAITVDQVVEVQALLIQQTMVETLLNIHKLVTIIYL
ncbi:MAG: hypothetical protein CMI60_10880 [Parvibaculum sp.]|nr:hypothetical protein [Parvibaculum sp.]